MSDITNFDRLKMITKKINNKKEYIRFLKFSKNFFDLDYKNQLLIYLQHPEAIQVKTFMDWKKEGKNIKKNPRKIFLYGYYKKKQDELLDGQIDIKGKENKKRKTTIEYFNGIPYRITCNYDISDTYIDRKNKIIPKLLNSKINFCNKEFLKCFIEIAPLENQKKDILLEMIEEFKLKYFYDTSCTIRSICPNFIKFDIDVKNEKLRKFVEETVSFLVTNYFEFDTKIYKFDEIEEFNKLTLENKIEIGSIIQKESKKIINLIRLRLKNKEQMCA